MALTLNGSSQYLYVDLPGPFHPAYISVCGWMYTTNLTQDAFIFALNNSSGYGTYYSIRFAGNVGGDPLRAYTVGPQGNGVASRTGIASGNWYWVQGEFFTGTDGRQIYINSGATSEMTDVNSPTGLNRISIGAFYYEGVWGYHFDGRLHNWSIRSSRDAYQDDAHYDYRYSTGAINPYWPKAVWPLNDVSGATVSGVEYSTTTDGTPGDTNHPYDYKLTVVGSPTVSRGPSLFGRGRIYYPSFAPSNKRVVNLSTVNLSCDVEPLKGKGNLKTLVTLKPTRGVRKLQNQTYTPTFYPNYFPSRRSILNFGTSTSDGHDVSVYWSFIMPRSYDGGSIIVRVHYCTNYDSRGDYADVLYRIDWNVYWENIHPGSGSPIDQDNFGPAILSHGYTTSPYEKGMVTNDIRCSNAEVAVYPGQLCRLKVRRWRDMTTYSYAWVVAVEVLEEVD